MEYINLRARLLRKDPNRTGKLIDGPVTRDLLQQAVIQPYVPTSLCQGATFYSNGISTGRKRLLVVFGGGRLRPGMPVPALLQRNHFRSGVSSENGTFSELLDIHTEVTGKRHYLETYAFGASMGGFPAIRFGLLVSCARAISFGGQPPNDAIRILKGTTTSAQAYDPICDCLSERALNFVFAYNVDTPQFGNWAQEYAKRISGSVVRVHGVKNHTILGQLWQQGRLDSGT